MTKDLILVFLIAGAVADFLLGIYVLFRKLREKSGLAFSNFCFWVGLWTLGIAAFIMTNDPKTALFWNKGFIFTAGIIPIAFVQFVRTFTGRPLAFRDNVLLYVPSLFILIAVMIPGVMIKDIVMRPWGKESLLGPGYIVYALFYAVYMAYAFIVLKNAYSKSTGLFRLRIKYVILSVFPSFLIAAYSNVFLLLLGNYNYIWLGPYGTFVLLLAVSYAITKYRLLDIKIAFTYASLFLVVYTLVLGIPLYLYSLSPGYLPLLLMFVLASIGPLWYRYLQSKADNILLADQKRYHKFLLQASEGMIEVHDLDKLLKIIAYIIKHSVRLEFAAVYLNDCDNRVFVLKGVRDSRWNFPALSIPYEHPLIQFMETHRDPFPVEELPADMKAGLNASVEGGLIVPSSSKDSLLGFLFMGPKQDRTVFTRDDINVFKVLANQAALAVMNCMFNERVKKDQEILLNEEKLALIGGMAAGVAHQFRNRLNEFVAISCDLQFTIEDYAKLIKAGSCTEEDTEKMLASALKLAKEVYDNSHRSTEVIQGILNLSQLQQEGDGLTECTLNELIHDAAINVKVKHKISDDNLFPLKIDRSCSGSVYANKLRLYECLYNMIDNAYEAIREKKNILLTDAAKESFVPRITIRLTPRARSSVIEISDNGIGVKPENKKKVFAPMFTTKPSSKISSSGIGAFFVKTAIERFHNGRVYFESEYKEGSTFYLELPSKQADSGEVIDAPGHDS